MVKFVDFADDQAEVELADGTKLRIPKAVIPQGTKPGSDFQLSQPQRRKASRRGSERSRQAFDFFMNKGWGPTAAAGIVGNLMQESGMALNPLAANVPEGSYGVAQHRKERLAQLRSFANKQGASWKDFGTQLAFVDWELRNTEKAAGDRLANAKDLREATFAMAGFERPSGWKGWGTNPEQIHGWENRFKFANSVLQGGGGGGPIAQGPSAATPGGQDQQRFNDSFRSQLAKLVGGKKSAPTVKRTKGQVVGDVISGGLQGLAAGQSDIEIPESPFASPNQFGSMSSQMAQSGPLPSIEESAQRLRDLL